MPLHIVDPAAEAAVRELAKLRGTTLTRAVELSAREALARTPKTPKPLDGEAWAAIREIQRRIASYPKNPEATESHKEFFDSMWSDD
jgi:hypothetical protein